MPVAKSDPRRATLVGVVGVIVGTGLIVVVLFANNLGGDDNVHTTTSRSSFDVGPAKSSADAITRDDTPLLFQDPVQFQRPIYVQHLGSDPATGWTSFDAAIGTCVLTWHKETHDFTDCNGTRYPIDGGTALHHYPATVTNDELFVDLNPDATTTTSS